MGGLVCRYYVQRLGGLQKTSHLITLSSPHNGTITAYLKNNTGAKQMRPQSKFLTELNSDVMILNDLKFTSIYNPLDLMIIPATSSKLNVGKDIKFLTIAHPLIVWNKKCFKIIERELMN